MKKTEYTCDLCKRKPERNDVCGVNRTTEGSSLGGPDAAETHICNLCVDAAVRFIEHLKSREERAIAP